MNTYFITPGFRINLTPAENALVANGWEPVIPRKLREYLGLPDPHSHALEAIEAQLDEDQEFDRFWDESDRFWDESDRFWDAVEDERPCPINSLRLTFDEVIEQLNANDEAIEQLKTIEFEPWDCPSGESLTIHSPIAFDDDTLPF